ncbi:L-allo-threonine aldolase [Pseudobythopirellula maris]|uniref:L-allo-threonine aldolase n=1 Tax=Pseudobythopirellula maris TaxID=2527991 RepID=A0A5C5ZID7_9BACT|nr:GntG family PLP-dependent aldolase [Pseudobythopirellula maris]TWT86948.1 L-allo-threonine aldolase [Pseudobythopirellula maris]
MIDLRSDTMTRPTAGMREAMARAEVGDDVCGEDPTVIALEERVAHTLGKEAALFVPSGTMGNQIGIRLHCQPGDEFLTEAESHVLNYEQAAYAQLFGLAARAVVSTDGLPAIDDLDAAVRPDSDHAPRTRLLTLENTHNRWGGRLLQLAEVERVCLWAEGRGLGRHLDAARLWNAAVATGQSPASLSKPFDTVSVCFSKGLGCPVGSVLAGPKEMIRAARRLRKALGGGWRQAGILAAAAIYALDNHIDRLAEDHRHADRLADAVREAPGLTLVDDRCDTNIVMFDVEPSMGTGDAFCQRLETRGVRTWSVRPQRVRALTHLDVDSPRIDEACEAILAVAGGE